MRIPTSIPALKQFGWKEEIFLRRKSWSGYLMPCSSFFQLPPVAGGSTGSSSMCWGVQGLFGTLAKHLHSSGRRVSEGSSLHWIQGGKKRVPPRELLYNQSPGCGSASGLTGEVQLTPKKASSISTLCLQHNLLYPLSYTSVPSPPFWDWSVHLSIPYFFACPTLLQPTRDEAGQQLHSQSPPTVCLHWPNIKIRGLNSSSATESHDKKFKVSQGWRPLTMKFQELRGKNTAWSEVPYKHSPLRDNATFNSSENSQARCPDVPISIFRHKFFHMKWVGGFFLIISFDKKQNMVYRKL